MRCSLGTDEVMGGCSLGTLDQNDWIVPEDGTYKVTLSGVFEGASERRAIVHTASVMKGSMNEEAILTLKASMKSGRDSSAQFHLPASKTVSGVPFPF